MSEFEIDHGDPKPESAAPPPVVASADDTAADARLRDALPAATARIAKAGQLRHVVDMWAAGLAGLCGQGLSGAPRIEPWTGSATLGLLASLGGLAFAAWMWRRSRVVADALWTLPVPLDEKVLDRKGARDERQRAVERKRREEEFARIEMFSDDLDHNLGRLRLAVWGAGAGAVCGWACAVAAPTGMMAMAGTLAALPGAVLGWRIAGGGWSALQVQRIAIGVLPACGLVGAIICDAPLLYAPIGAVVVAAAGWMWRPRILAIAGVAAEPAETAAPTA